jgi:hypothetical protein
VKDKYKSYESSRYRNEPSHYKNRHLTMQEFNTSF